MNTINPVAKTSTIDFKIPDLDTKSYTNYNINEEIIEIEN